MTLDLELIAMALPLLATGALVTIKLAAVGVGMGLPLGLGLALLRLAPNRLLAGLGDGYAGLFRGTPMLVQLFILYYGLAEVPLIRQTPALWWFFRDALFCAGLAVVLNTTAYTSEIFRTALRAIPQGQIEAALAVGMRPWTLLTRIRLPLAFRNALPVYASEAITVVKETSLASTITVLEITGQAKRLMSQTFGILEIFALASLFYLVINLACLGAFAVLERRQARGMRP
jgi:octopine/nopaline transport system permease protein